MILSTFCYMRLTGMSNLVELRNKEFVMMIRDLWFSNVSIHQE